MRTNTLGPVNTTRRFNVRDGDLVAESDEEKGSENENEKDNDDDDDDDDAEQVSPPTRTRFIPDVEYDQEVGYSLIRAMRGRSTGRRLKRDFFKNGVSQFLVSVAMIIMTDQAARNYTVTNFFAQSVFGQQLLSLWWLVCIIGFMLSFVTMFVVFGWPSLVTNRSLTSTILKIYMLIQLVNWIFTLATLVTTFRTFGERKRYVDGTYKEAVLFPYYLTSVFFLLPYMFCICSNAMNISYLNDEVEFGGVILEPDSPENVWDLSGMTLEQVIRAMVAYPVAIAYQTLELLLAIYSLLLRMWRRLQRLLEDRWLQYQQQQAQREKDKKKHKGLIARIIKTMTRWGYRCWNRRELYREEQETRKRKEDERRKQRALQAEQELKQAAVAKEELERMERERAELEAERKYQREKEERIRREEEERERKKRAAEEEKEQRRKESEAAANPILSVPEFRTLWSSLGVSGQFQCRLKENPALVPLTEHLRKQGFHIVFGSTPAPDDVEIGICNIKENALDPRFMARFLSSQQGFSAVMKSENAEAVPVYVKKFALAKILKINTAKS